MLANPTTRLSSEEERRRKREKELLLLLLFLRVTLDKHARQFVAGYSQQTDFLFLCMTAIRQAHYAAAQLGVVQAGAVAYNPYSVAERAAAAQESFLAAFATDLANGRYDPRSDGGEGARARKQRFELYALRLTGTANAAWLAALPRTTEVLWVLGENEDHCSTCRYESAQLWRPVSHLTRTPGDGSTICITNCRCHLQTRDGLMSFHNL